MCVCVSNTNREKCKHVWHSSKQKSIFATAGGLIPYFAVLSYPHTYTCTHTDTHTHTHTHTPTCTHRRAHRPKHFRDHAALLLVTFLFSAHFLNPGLKTKEQKETRYVMATQLYIHKGRSRALPARLNRLSAS
jgi:hypothetical protein